MLWYNLETWEMQMKYGPFKVGSTIPKDSLVGVHVLLGQLYVVVGEFEVGTSKVPADTDRQDIDATGQVTSSVYSGPPISSNVMVWSKIPD